MPNLFLHAYNGGCFPESFPTMSSGKLNCRIRLKTDYKKKDNTYQVYIQITLKRVVKKISLDFSVRENEFENERIKRNNKNYKDYNLYIEKKLADINTIEVNYRIAGKILTLDLLIEELNNPTARVDFILFWEKEMIRQKEILKSGTYRQQMTVLNKVKAFKNPLYFYDIDENYLTDLKAHCKRKLKNNDNTVASLIKSFKKYLHLANKKGITTPINFSEIKNKSFKGNRTFLTPDELKVLKEYWDSKFITSIHKNILARFLFSCFTGLRFTDVANISTENFIENTIVFTAEKTGKFQRIRMNETAKYFLYDDFFKISSTNEYTNRELKHIAKACKITKNLTFHVSRHTFATNFLICGGRVEHLQKLLGHSKIEETMLYVHIVEQITDIQIFNMDEIMI
ncbi:MULTISPECIES: site-specific integrase [Flavobacterium]|uniref:Tyrosine-type recombinase/integrase n=1 Tax=Flavobacterium jumunjinense TaxID=998845 RepID=A0ABV5GSK6_9FLAO|nr:MULTISPECIES: site-specific integrase [Flavobacterium]